MKSIKVKLYQSKNIDLENNQKVLGYDELEKKFKLVSYRRDSNRFFEYKSKSWVPYPLDRMHRYKLS